jgi:hypothetical protein
VISWFTKFANLKCNLWGRYSEEFTQVMEASKKEVSRALERAGRRRGGCTTAGVREELGLQ